jgi:AraC family transcriptional regulator of adaptative response/methylated-DNA-[protein]-cysteine methyltransferase
MSTQNQIDYNRIAKAIEYIQSNFRLQPSLEEVAENSLESGAFSENVFRLGGTSPKKFLQFISLEHAKIY